LVTIATEVVEALSHSDARTVKFEHRHLYQAVTDAD
jgi:hypothetical protein